MRGTVVPLHRCRVRLVRVSLYVWFCELYVLTVFNSDSVWPVRRVPYRLCARFDEA